MDKDSNMAEDKNIISDNTLVGVEEKEEEIKAGGNITAGGNIKVVEGTVSINCIRVKDNGAGIDKLP